MSSIACYIFLNNGENKMAFDKAKFKKKMKENGFTQKKIAEVLTKVTLDTTLIRKKMTLQGEFNDGWHR